MILSVLDWFERGYDLPITVYTWHTVILKKYYAIQSVSQENTAVNSKFQIKYMVVLECLPRKNCVYIL